jgi:hypothetical protein
MNQTIKEAITALLFTGAIILTAVFLVNTFLL